jgi:hypothetical protein
MIGQCQICGAVKSKSSKMRFVLHHTSYEPEITISLCYPCHAWLHGNGRIYRHPFKEKYGRDKAPYEFARAVVNAYDIDKEWRTMVRTCDSLGKEADNKEERMVYLRNAGRIRSKMRRDKARGVK